MTTRRHMLLVWIAWAIALGASPVRADDRPSFHAEIGLGGERVAGWTPIRVWITGGDRAADGMVVLEHDQDTTQKTRIAAPFATTPGQTISVELASYLPGSLMSLRLSLVDRRGAPLGSIRYAVYGGGEGDLQLTPEASALGCRILAVGSHSLGSTFSDRPSLSAERVLSVPESTHPGEPDVTPWLVFNESGGPSTPTILVGDLPTRRIAYEQADAIVVSGESSAKADPRAIAAILGWVEQGGRLVIVADDSTPYWRGWLPAGPAGDLVVAEDPREVAAPEAVRALYGVGLVQRPETSPIDDAEHDEEADEDVAANGEESGDEPGAAPMAEPIPELTAVAESFPARVLALTDRARREGWVLRWRLDDGHGLIAEGPLAHGWVTIVGVDPRATSGLLSRAAQLRVWPSVLANAVGDAVPAPDGGQYNQYERPDAGVISAGIEFIAGVGAPEHGAFIAIMGLMAGLALALGPLDFFGLKRLSLRHRSWLTALGWIGIASVFAYVGPRLVRVSRSQFQRLECVDRIVDPEAPLGAPGRASIFGISGHYAGTSERVVLENDRTDSWWRGVSADSFYSQTRGASPTVSIVQAPGGLSGPAPSGRIEEFAAGVWTFRTFADDSMGEVSATGRAWRDDAGVWHASLAGLEPGASVEHVMLRVGESWIPMFGDGEYTGAVESGASAPVREQWDESRLELYGSSRPDLIAEGDPRPLLHALASAARREPALEARLSSGRWAAIHAVVRDSSPSPRARGVQEQGRLMLLRVQTPIEPGAVGDDTKERP